MRSFASDNNASIDLRILSALQAANQGHAVGYGDDPLTSEAERVFEETFGEGIETYLVFNGTGANVVALSLMLRQFESVLCSAAAHINCDECGAPELVTGCKLTLAHHEDGKVRPEDIDAFMAGRGVSHHVQPRAVSISQTTETGLCYTLAEIRELAQRCRAHQLFLHLDGARLSNAAASLGSTLRGMTRDCGVDVLSFGGTKNGLMCGEAVVVFNPRLFGSGEYIRKQTGQLASKMRYLSAQFIPYLRDGIWLQNAKHANAMARVLAEQLSLLPEVEIKTPIEANAIFARLPEHAIAELMKSYFFYVWDREQHLVRWMTSFDTTEEDVDDFVRVLAGILAKGV